MPADLAARHGLHVIPLGVYSGEQGYRNGVDLMPSLYPMLAQAPDLPAASQPSAAEGQDGEQVAATAERLVPWTSMLSVVDTLEYLRKGGRIGGVSALAGSLISIKPILHIHKGRIDALDKARTRRKALDRLLEIVAEREGILLLGMVSTLAARRLQLSAAATLEEDVDLVVNALFEGIGTLRSGLSSPAIQH